MTIDEAIKRLQARVAYAKKNYPDYPADDVMLGIEALKNWKLLRQGRARVIAPLLKGETES